MSREQRAALEQTMNRMEQAAQPETWFDGNKVNDVLFCEDFLAGHPMKCIHGTFFDINGAIGDAEQIKAEIYRKIAPYVTSNIAKKAASLLDAPRPSRWLSFVGQLLEPEDIATLQEFMGYVLLPTTKGQKMMIVIGKGGEGKSRIGRVLRALLGDSMNTGSIQKVEVDRFARADLEWKLLMLDDDMKLEALPQTNNIKSIVTLEDKTDLERKGRQSEQGYLCVRFICFGNGNLDSLYDRSYGFFRRQIVLTVKEREPGREDDPFLGEKLIAEAEGIFLWCLEGLHRLIDNRYRFTISKRAEDNLTKAMQDGNNIIVFMESEGYIRLEQGTHATSKQLYGAYSQWCEDNLEKPLGERSFSNYLRARKVPIPAYWHHVRGERTWQGYKGEGDASNYRWFDTTVRSILQHEVYIGNLVAQRQTHIFKVGKSFVRPKEEWVIVEDVFEPIVDRELWERVQEGFANPTRSRKRTGQASIFSGMVFCDTCNRRISFVPERAEKIYVGSCQEYRKIGKQGCTPHRIYEQDLYDTVLKDIREWAKLALKDEKAVLDRVMEHESRNHKGTDHQDLCGRCPQG